MTLEDAYVGKRNIKTVESHTYLGEIVSHDLSNRKNIMSKAAKGKAVVRDILQILEGVYFGEHYFEALKLLRESMLISVLTSNLEVSFNLSTKDLQLLIDVENQLLRAALKTSAKSSRVLLLLEIGVCSIDFILKKKRILYLYHLLTVEGMPLVKQVFDKQLLTTTFGDWTKTVTKDLEDLNINL